MDGALLQKSHIKNCFYSYLRNAPSRNLRLICFRFRTKFIFIGLPSLCHIGNLVVVRMSANHNKKKCFSSFEFQIFSFFFSWGQFHQPSGAKHKCVIRQSLVPFHFSNKTVLNFVNTLNYNLRSTLTLFPLCLLLQSVPVIVTFIN